MDPEHVDASQSIHRQTGPTFYLATRLFPRRIRRSTYVLYAFLRTADEVVDGSDLPPAAQRERLEHIRGVALGEDSAADPVLAAFQDLRVQQGIPDTAIDEFIDAMCMDIEIDRYETMADLDRYMGGSAAAVGEMMTAIIGTTEPAAARPHARALGEAFQLTNFVRDVREDVEEHDRVYIPETLLEDQGIDTETVRSLEPSPAIDRAVHSMLLEAEDRYREGVRGIDLLSSDCQYPVLLASLLYSEHHRSIRGQDYDVISQRPSISLPRKAWCLARSRWQWQWNDDPVKVFRRLSAIPSRQRRPDPLPGRPTRSER